MKLTGVKEYIGKKIEVVAFCINEEIENNNELIKEFNELTKSRIKPQVKYKIGMENEVNNDLF